MKTSLLFFCLWVISTCVWAGPEHQTSEIILLKDFHFLVDSTQELTANEIGHLLSSDAFEHAETQFVHFTIEQPVVWLSFNHRTIKGNPCYVSPGNESNIWNASLFVKDSVGGYVELFEYDHLEKDLDPRSLYFSTLAINLPPNGEDFLLRLRAPQNRSYNLILGSRYAISKHLILRERVSIAFIGFMLCIFIYNSFLFISTRLKVLIPYLAYLLMVTFAVPFHSGFVLYSTPGMWQGEPWYTVWLAPTHAAIGFFCIQYLNLKEIAPKFRKLILVLMALLTIATPILDFNHWVSVSWMSRIVPVLVVLYNTCLWTSGVYVWINGAKHARFYVMGWIFVIASLTVFSLSMFGMIPYNPNIDFVLYFGFASESVLFAFALGDQMNMLRKKSNPWKKLT